MKQKEIDKYQANILATRPVKDWLLIVNGVFLAALPHILRTQRNNK